MRSVLVQASHEGTHACDQIEAQLLRLVYKASFDPAKQHATARPRDTLYRGDGYERTIASEHRVGYNQIGIAPDRGQPEQFRADSCHISAGTMDPQAVSL